MNRLDPPAPVRGPEPRKVDVASSLRRAAMVSGFCLLIGIGLGIARGGQWLLQTVYAESIGLSIWLFIDLGRLLFRRDPDSNWPVGWRKYALQIGGIVGGYLLGTWIGDQYCGCSSFEAGGRWSGPFTAYLVFSIGVSVSISYFFLSRGRDQRRLREIADAERDAAEAKLKLLASQLEPHMLFNTLANLRALIVVDPPRAQTMLDQLIAFLRATLSASREPFHTLAAEFARISDYLALMQVRMGERLDTRISLPEELASIQVPPLLLQPLVENAIKHGLEPKVAGGRIEIGAVRRAGSIVLTVRDSGAGLAQRSANAGLRFGLEHVQKRLATIYGERARFELRPAADAEGGSIATIELPA